MLIQHLKTLHYPNLDAVDEKDIKKLREIIAWLECNMYQKWTSDQQRILKNVEAPDWDDVFESYKETLECYIPNGNLFQYVCRLASKAAERNIIYMSLTRPENKLAIHLYQYIKALFYSQIRPVEIDPCLSKPETETKGYEFTADVVKNMLDSVDFTDKKVKMEINEIIMLLQNMRVEGLLTLKAMSFLIHHLLLDSININDRHLYLAKMVPIPPLPKSEALLLEDADMLNLKKVLHYIYSQVFPHLEPNVAGEAKAIDNADSESSGGS